jgi:hypothetical protein
MQSTNATTRRLHPTAQELGFPVGGLGDILRPVRQTTGIAARATARTAGRDRIRPSNVARENSSLSLSAQDVHVRRVNASGLSVLGVVAGVEYSALGLRDVDSAWSSSTEQRATGQGVAVRVRGMFGGGAQEEISSHAERRGVRSMDVASWPRRSEQPRCVHACV